MKEGFEYGLTPARMVQMLSHQFRRQYILPEEAEAAELTPMQSHVLKFILAAPEDAAIYQKDIEREFEIRKPTASGILKLLEKNGFIRRESVACDARLKRIVLTKKAQRLRGMILERLKCMDERVVCGISEAELAVCMKVLWQMFCNLKSDTEATNDSKGGQDE